MEPPSGDGGDMMKTGQMPGPQELASMEPPSGDGGDFTTLLKRAVSEPGFNGAAVG